MSFDTFFDDYTSAFWSDRMHEVVDCYHTPVGVFTKDQSFVLKSRDALRKALDDYHAELVKEGVSHCTVRVVGQSLSRGANASVWVEYSVHWRDGSPTSKTTVRYFMSDTGAGPRICMVEYNTSVLGLPRFEEVMMPKAA